MMFTAKRAAVLAAVPLTFFLVSGATAEPTAPVKHPQVPTELKQWVYPGASCFASMTNSPMVMAQFTTSAPVHKVAGFYRHKVSRGKYAEGLPQDDEVAWSDHTHGGDGGINAMMGGSTTNGNPTTPSNCLYFVRKARQMITIQVRRVEAERQTQITLFSAQR